MYQLSSGSLLPHSAAALQMDLLERQAGLSGKTAMGLLRAPQSACGLSDAAMVATVRLQPVAFLIGIKGGCWSFPQRGG